MFIGAVGDFMFPDLIGKILNNMKDGESDELYKNLVTWACVIVIGAVGTFIN